MGDEAAIETLRSMIRADEDATASFSSTKLNILIFRAHWGYLYPIHYRNLSPFKRTLYIVYPIVSYNELTRTRMKTLRMKPASKKKKKEEEKEKD